MSAPSATDLAALADVIVRVGVNLQPGQPLLIAEPYELQGVDPAAAPLVEAVAARAREIGKIEAQILWGDPAEFRRCAELNDLGAFSRLVSANSTTMQRHLAAGGAFLFLLGSRPALLQGIPAASAARLRELAWEEFGPVIQPLINGASQWCVAPAPTADWAEAAFADLATEERLSALWRIVLESCRCHLPDPVAAWETHLAELERRGADLNARRVRAVRYRGDGTDLTVTLPGKHRWCTAAHLTRGGIRFVQNLPTDELFTAPHRASATGRVRVARPVSYAGRIMEGIELEFSRGIVTGARAARGEDVLRELLATDEGAARLGEVAFIPGESALRRAGRLFHHPLLDENALPHVALGAAYRFCLDSFFPFGLNRSLLHVDLPLEATLEFDPPA